MCKKLSILSLLLATSALYGAEEEANYKIVAVASGTSDTWYGATFQVGENQEKTGTVLFGDTIPEVDNLSFASDLAPIRFSGKNNGYYVIKNIVGEANQEVSFYSNTGSQKPFIANIIGDGTGDERFHFNYGSDTSLNSQNADSWNNSVLNIFTPNKKDDNSFDATTVTDGQSVFSNSIINIKAAVKSTNLTLQNTSLTVTSSKTTNSGDALGTESTFKSLTIDGTSEVQFNEGKYKIEAVTTTSGDTVSRGNSLVMNSGAKLSVADNANLTIGSTTKVTTSSGLASAYVGGVSMKGNSSISLGNGTHRVGNISMSAENNLTPTITLNGGSLTTQQLLINAGSVTATNNAQISVNEYIQLSGLLEVTGGKGSLRVDNKIRFNTGGVLKLHGSEMLTKTLLTDTNQNITAISVNIYGDARIELGGNESFDEIGFSYARTDGVHTSKTLTFVLSDNTTLLSIKDLTGVFSADYVDTLIGETDTYSWQMFYDFENFKDGVVRITDVLTNEELSNCFKVDGVVTVMEQRDGYLYVAAVPEPAEWAMIFGAIALGFVAYRRRK